VLARLKPQTLRTRLVALLLAVAAVGLLTLAAVTYASQRSFLQDRIDDQAREGLPAVGRELDERLGVTRSGPFGGFGFGPAGKGRGGPPGGVDLPPGTYVERIEAGTGTVLLAGGFRYGGGTVEALDLPDDIDAGDLRTVEADERQYRVAAERNRTDGNLNVIAIPLAEMNSTLSRLLLVEGIVIVGVLAILGGVALLVVRVGLRPLDRMAATADEIRAGDLSRRVEPADDTTEVGRLGLALNTMLGGIENAFAGQRQSEDRLRRFVADASHELRTPLASIRGYAELFRMGAVQDPADTSTAMRRIEEEARRMGVLVEDLLALARLDETRATVREPVDVGDLAADAVEDARVVAPDREISLVLDGSEDPIVSADPDQLRQVLANLVRNALVHTPAGTAIEVHAGTRSVGAPVVLEVRDHGPGLPTDDPSTLFERFWRAGGDGRKQGPAGAGLGLAIVAGIVDAHGGTVRAENAAFGGARFVVELPAYDDAAVPSNL